jgi:hypothetical protein
MNNNIFNWGSESNEDRRQREQREMEFMFEQARSRAAKISMTGGVGSGGGENSPIFDGVVLDGPISGATVYDPATGVTVTTNSDGEFRFKYIPNGALEATGGVDTITGLPYLGKLRAPFGAKVISPISTVIDRMIDGGMSESEAKIRLSDYSKEEAGFQAFDSSTISKLMNIDYIKEAVIDNEDYAIVVQSLANRLEILVELSAGVVVSPAVSGNVNDPNFASEYTNAKETCWNSIADRIRTKQAIEPEGIINQSISDPSIEQSMRDAANEVHYILEDAMSEITYDSALNINYQTTTIYSINKTAKGLANSLVTTWALPPAEKSDLVSCMAAIQGEESQVSEKVDENKGTLNRVRKDANNVILETYSGYGIEEISINYITEFDSLNSVIFCSGENVIYAKSFIIGSNIWSTTDVLKIDGSPGELEIGYRYKWPLPDSQEHKFLFNNNVYTVSSIIGKNVDERQKEKQAYISKIQTLDSYMLEIGAEHIKIPAPNKIKLEDPRKNPGGLAAVEVPPGEIASNLVGKELNKVDPAEVPVVKDAEIEGAVRTEEKKYENVEDGIEVIEVIEIKDGEKVKEELVIEVDDKKLKNEVVNDNAKDEKNIDDGGEKLIHPADKEFKEEGGTEKSIAVRSKAEENFLEAE